MVTERLLEPFLQQVLWKDQITARISFVCLIMLLAAASIWLIWGRERHGFKVTAVYWLACGVVTLAVLYLPRDRVLPGAAIAIAAVTMVFAYLPYWRYKRRRNRVVPDQLEMLMIPFRPAPGLTTSTTALALLVFFINLCYVTSVSSVAAAAMMGIALLILVGHGFREESAFAGIILISEAIVCCVLVVCVGPGPVVPATVINLVIIILSILALFWIWLGAVWTQQIIDGQPLTTAARMVPLTVHAGMMMLGFASLLLFKLAIWPELPMVSGFDNGATRLVLLALAGLLVLGVNFWIAARRPSAILGLIFALNLFAVMLAYLVRWPWLKGYVIMPYLSIWVVGVGLVYLLLAVMFYRRNHPGLARPAGLAAELVCPALVIWAAGRQTGGLKPSDIAVAFALAGVAWFVLRVVRSSVPTVAEEP